MSAPSETSIGNTSVGDTSKVETNNNNKDQIYHYIKPVHMKLITWNNYSVMNSVWYHLLLTFSS